MLVYIGYGLWLPGHFTPLQYRVTFWEILSASESFSNMFMGNNPVTTFIDHVLLSITPPGILPIATFPWRRGQNYISSSFLSLTISFLIGTAMDCYFLFLLLPVKESHFGAPKKSAHARNQKS
jgi:tetrahydromethanopterin S-methyltransferase subunit B